MRQLKNMQDVVDWGMCIGCGACAAVCDQQAVSLVNIPKVGIRPDFDSSCATCNQCLSFCPGYQVDATSLIEETSRDPNHIPDAGFGETLEIWEGHAADEEIRYNASSGGVLTALSLYCLENEEVDGVIHTASDSEQPWINKTVRSTSREELLRNTGSRYAPASPADGLKLCAEQEKPSVVIGKPCDAAAVAMLRQQRREIDDKVGLLLTFFCAGTPSLEGSFDLMKKMQVEKEELTSLRYRGEGWPGGFKTQTTDGDEKFMTYKESWSQLQRYRPFRCQLCPDGLGRLGDIACGDAWEKYTDEGTGSNDTGRSIVLVRTEKGRRILQRAMEKGYLTLERVGVENVLDAQVNLLGKRRWLWGRSLGMKLLGAPVTKYVGFNLYPDWMKLPFKEKFKTIVGTMRRVLMRKLYKRHPLFDK